MRELKEVYISIGPSFPYYGEGFTPPSEPVDPVLRNIGDIELRPGKEVTGIVQSADGKPLVGVKMIANSQVPKNERELHGVTSVGQVRSIPPPASQDETRTDASGRFRVMMITPGEGMLEMLPTDGRHALHFEFVYDRRGELGTIKLARGQSITGRVLDAGGKPLVGVFISASPWAHVVQKYSGDGVSVFQNPQRTAVSDSEGYFVLESLPTDDYLLVPSASFRDPMTGPHEAPDLNPVPGLFMQQKVTLSDNQPLVPIEIRALPTVTIEGRFIIPEPSANMVPPGRGIDDRQRLSTLYLSRMAIQGKWNDWAYRQSIQTGEDWSFRLNVPKGLREATVLLPATISVSGSAADSRDLRWRIGTEGDFHTEPEIDLGTLDADARNLEIDYSRLTNPRPGGFGGGAAVPAGVAAPAAAAGGGGRGGAAAGGRPAAANRNAANPAGRRAPANNPVQQPEQPAQPQQPAQPEQSQQPKSEPSPKGE
jgi:hypothetical protein